VDNIYTEKGMKIRSSFGDSCPGQGPFPQELRSMCQDGEVIIVDESPAAPAGQALSEGCSQAIEAKENVQRPERIAPPLLPSPSKIISFV